MSLHQDLPDSSKTFPDLTLAAFRSLDKVSFAKTSQLLSRLCHDLSSAIMRKSASTSLLSDCLEILQQHAPCDSISVWVYDKHGQSLRATACAGDPLWAPRLASTLSIDSATNTNDQRFKELYLQTFLDSDGESASGQSHSHELLRISLSSAKPLGLLAALVNPRDAATIRSVLHFASPILTAVLERAEEVLTTELDEQAIQVALEVAQEVTWDWDLSSSRLTMNARWASHLGFDFEDSGTIERYARRLLHPEDMNNCMCQLRAHLKGESDIYAVQHRILDKSGKWQWFIVQGRVYKRDSDGRALRMAGIHRNIDQDREAEDALRASEERLRSALTASKAEIWEINLKTSECRYDDRARAFLGYNSEEIPNDTTIWFGLIHPDDKSHVLQSFIDHVQGRSDIYRIEARYRTKSGSWKWMANVGRVVEWDEQGYPVRMAGIYTDIDERKRSQLKLSEKEAKYRLLAEYSSDVIFLLTPDSTINYVSPACQTVLGYEPHEMLGRRGIDFLDAKDVDYGLLLINEISGHPGSTTRELQFRKKDESVVWLEVNARAIVCAETGQVKELVGALRDITERKQREVELLRAREAADAANRAKSDFLAAMSHELRSPLHGVIGMVELLSKTRLSDQQRSFVQSASKAAQLLHSSINDILDFTKIEAGKLELDFAPFSIVDMIADVELLFHESAKAKGLALTVDISPHLPSQVYGDEIRIRQSIINLVSNAVKFTFHGGVSITVRQQTDAAESMILRFEVADTGIGIPEKAQSQLFSPFMQADRSTSRTFGGSGLGLAISKRLIDIMGGTIAFESTAGSGTRFWIDLPVILVPEDKISESGIAPSIELENNTVLDSDPVDGTHHMISKYHQILIVEDNEIGAEVAAELLRPRGFTISFADNGAKAIELFRDTEFDLILMDCQLPILDGYKTTRIIRTIEAERRSEGRDTPPIPIIALTASALRGDREKCISAGMNDYLTKPLSQFLLFEAIDKQLGTRQESLTTSTNSVSGDYLPIGPADLAWAIERFNNDEPFVASLAKNYLLGEPSIRNNIIHFAESRDFDSLAFQAHSLAGLVSVFGARGISDLSNTIEADASSRRESCFMTASLKLLPILESFQKQLLDFVERSITRRN